MSTDPTAPATKQDIALLMEQMGRYYQRTERQIAEVKEDIVTMKEDIVTMKEDIVTMKEDIVTWKKEIIHEFHIITENLIHDFRGALNDKIQNHENRITRIEDRVELAA